MKKEKEDQRNHSAFREQMGNYKKLRQEHRKTMMELEAKLEKEMENHQRNLQHELHRQRKKHEEDRHKQARKRHAHIEKISKDDELEGKIEQKLIYFEARRPNTKCSEKLSTNERTFFETYNIQLIYCYSKTTIIFHLVNAPSVKFKSDRSSEGPFTPCPCLCLVHFIKRTFI